VTLQKEPFKKSFRLPITIMDQNHFAKEGPAVIVWH